MATMTTQDVIQAIINQIGNAPKFKIGKTGQKVEGRFDADQDYKKNYSNIHAICQHSSKSVINKTEEDMILHFSQHPLYKYRLDNQQVGGGEMKDSSVYVVYVVY